MKVVSKLILCLFAFSAIVSSCNDNESETIDDSQNSINSESGFKFSGFNWIVKETKNIADSRYFCLTSKNNVVIGKDGSITLKLTKNGNIWSGGELTIDTTLGYGDYSFEIYTLGKNLDPNATLSFTILNITDDFYEGMTQTGVRFTKYSEVSAKSELEYFLYATDKKIAEVDSPDTPFLLSPTPSVHKVGVYPDYLYYSSKSGNFYNETKIVKQGNATAMLDDALTFSPSTDKLKVIFSICLGESNEPAGADGLEVVIKNFKFSPAIQNLTKK